MKLPPEISKQKYGVGKAKERMERRGGGKFYEPLTFRAKVYAKETLKGAGSGAAEGAALGYIGTVAFKYVAGKLVPYVTKEIDEKLESYLNDHPATKFILDVDKKQGEFWRNLLGKDKQVTMEKKKEYTLLPSGKQIMPAQGWEMYVIGGFAFYSALKGAAKRFLGAKKKIKEIKERKKIEKEISELSERLATVEHQLAEKYEKQKNEPSESGNS